ncbi:testis expressed protein 56-like [Ambystoma mexicanum]|uniref:testis expressed protein 56-like n=1 Tax=Ambystoma mexicanum TaxID=8296 RepID=UPI0037E93287
MFTDSRDNGSLKLPPLVKPNVVGRFESPEDVNELFKKLSKQHNKLQDPLKELLYHCAMYEDDKESREGSRSLVPCFEKHLAREEPPCEVYFSPPPDHVSQFVRCLSNQKSKTWSEMKVGLRSTPMATILVRWQARDTVSQCDEQDQQFIIDELSRLGPIDSVTSVGRNAALVVFHSITIACKAIRVYPRKSAKRIQCYWYNKFMSKNKFKPADEKQN